MSISSPRLPVELWIRIFRLATYEPGLLDVEWNYDLVDARSRNWSISVPEMLSDHPTKRRIVQVCQTWRELGMVFFSEGLALNPLVSNATQPDKLRPRGSRLSELVAIFDSNPSRGELTKRIVCNGQLLEDQFEDVLRLLERCRNLSNFSIFNHTNVKREQLVELAQLFEKRFSHSLRKINYASTSLSDPLDSRSIIPDVAIQSLYITACGREYFIPQRALHSITTLALGLRRWDGIPVHLPSLQHLHLPRIKDSDGPAALSFLEPYSKTLKSLFLLKSPGEVQWLLPFLARSNIQLLALSNPLFVRWVGLKPLLSFPSVVHLALELPIAQPETDQQFIIALNEAVQNNLFQNLRIIRLLGGYSTKIARLLGYERTKETLDRCRERNIRVEARDGQEVAISS